ncbi:hypothetical protein EPO34_01295 [Patescibacteria group bacterium]|nr:MAG: hypothetical protein EPO34_01295 [Patescibacteria group bacterium]
MKCPTCARPLPDLPSSSPPGVCAQCQEGFKALDRALQKDRARLRRRKPLADVLSRHLRQGKRPP